MFNFIKIENLTLIHSITNFSKAIHELGYNYHDFQKNMNAIRVTEDEKLLVDDLLRNITIPDYVEIDAYWGHKGEYTAFTNISTASALGSRELDRYVIELNLSKLLDSDSLSVSETIRHELVHIDQIRRGDLSVINGETWWKGENWGSRMMEVYSRMAHGERDAYVEYFLFPWESEANNIDVMPMLLDIYVNEAMGTL